MVRYREKKHRRRGSARENGGPGPGTPCPERGGAADRQDEAVPVKPMTPEEAVLQLELVGHDFFVFRNAESSEVNVVYRRRDGNYGLIEPQ